MNYVMPFCDRGTRSASAAEGYRFESSRQMRIFLAGVSCVGKTTVGTNLAGLRRVPFFDLDREVERFFSKPIAQLQSECRTMDAYRRKASKVLGDLLRREDSRNCVIALPPSGLMGGYWKTIRPADGVVVVLVDTPENVVERLAFYDDDSRPVEKDLSSSEKRYYVREVRADMAYFGRSYKKADLAIDIAGLSAREAAAKVNAVLSKRPEGEMRGGK